MTQQSPSRTSDKAVIRMPDGMRSWIGQEAKKNFRSANAQIVWMLQRQINEVEATTGESLPASPSSSPNETALQGGPITHG